MHVGLQTQELPGWNLKLVPSTRRVGRPKKEADHSRLVGGRFDKEGNLLTRLILGGRKASRSSYPPARILSFYRGLNGVQPRTQFRVLTHCSLEAASLKTAPAVGTVGGAYIPRRGGARSLLPPGSTGGCGYVLSMSSSNNASRRY